MSDRQKMLDAVDRASERCKALAGSTNDGYWENEADLLDEVWLLLRAERADRFVAVLGNHHDRTRRKAVIVPAGQSLDFDPDAATRRWLAPHLAGEWHLIEFLPIAEEN